MCLISILKKIGFTVIFLFVSTSCSLLQKVEPKKVFQVNAYWTQQAVKNHPNHFRKINRMTPVVHDNQLIVGNAYDGLVSYDLEKYNEKWRATIDLGVEASAAQINDRLFIGSNSGKMYSIDMHTGQIVWSFDSKSELVSEPLLIEAVLYFVTGGQSLVALDASSGKMLWNHTRQDTENFMTIRGGSKPAYSDGLIYSGFSDGSLVALNAKTGSPQWEIRLNKNSRFKDIDASPIIDGDKIYISSYDDKLYCLSKKTAEILWSAPYGGATAPLVTENKIFVSSSAGALLSLSKNNGDLIWKINTNEGVFTEPLKYLDLIVVGESQGKLLFVNESTGAIVDSFEPGRGVFSKPLINKNKVYFISGEGNIYGVRAEYDTKKSIPYLL